MNVFLITWSPGDSSEDGSFGMWVDYDEDKFVRLVSIRFGDVHRQEMCRCRRWSHNNYNNKYNNRLQQQIHDCYGLQIEF